MNVLAGILIGTLCEKLFACLLLPFIWGGIHCLYGFTFKLHDNPIVKSTKSGRPITSYYMARYFTGSLTSLIFSVISHAIYI